jgi:hypothetical protein
MACSKLCSRIVDVIRHDGVKTTLTGELSTVQ